MLGVGQVLHQRYRIVRPLGHGGMGAVYEAIDERFGGPIALKEIVYASSSPHQREQVARAFEREAKALAKAQHEAIPYVRDYFTELDRQFLVMELIEGDDLAGMLLKRQAPFPMIDCLKWMDQLLDALDYLHTLEPQIIHRDIKPQNLKLNRRGRIKLLDFGIAKSSEAGGPTLSNQTFVGATLDYSPIEQILRAIEPTFREYILLRHKEKADDVLGQNTDARCDIYSLGATFYHLLTNHPPPDAVKRTLELWENRPDPLSNPSNLNPAIPPQISQCVMTAMSVDRVSRYASALDMQKALHAAAAENKSLAGHVFNDSWKDAQALREEIGDQQVRRHEHQLMQAETVRLDPSEVAELRAKADTGPQGMPTEPLIFGHAEARVTDEYKDPEPTPTFITEPSVEVEPNNETEAADSVSGRKTDVFRNVQPPPKPQPVQKRRSTAPYWILGITAAVLFVVVGVTAAVLLAGIGSRTSENDSRNVNSGFPSETPTPFPTDTPVRNDNSEVRVVEPTPTPTRVATPTPLRTPISTPEPTPRRTPVVRPTPERTPIVRPTPRRTPPPRKTPNPNCVYDNTCG